MSMRARARRYTREYLKGNYFCSEWISDWFKIRLIDVTDICKLNIFKVALEYYVNMKSWNCGICRIVLFCMAI